MPWAKFSDDTHRNEHILRLTVPARWLWVAAIIDNRDYGDGRSPFLSITRARALVRQQGVSQKLIAELEASGRWEPIEGGWNIHDFKDFLPSRKEAQDDRKPDPIKQAAGQKGADQRWHTDNKPVAGPITDEWQAGSKPVAPRARGHVDPAPAPVPTPSPSLDSNSTPKVPHTSDGAFDEPTTELGLGMHELLGRQLSGVDLLECKAALNQYAYLTARELIVRAHDHVDWCRDHEKPTPRTVGGFADSWRRENDWRSDQGMPKAERRSGARVDGMTKAFPIIPQVAS